MAHTQNTPNLNHRRVSDNGSEPLELVKFKSNESGTASERSCNFKTFGGITPITQTRNLSPMGDNFTYFGS